MKNLNSVSLSLILAKKRYSKLKKNILIELLKVQSQVKSIVKLIFPSMSSIH